MPSKGLLTHKSLKRYGTREDERTQGREKLFNRIKNFVAEKAILKSDENPRFLT